MSNILPIDIPKKEFQKSFRGYNPEEVDEFLDKISKSYEKIYIENQDYKEEIKSLQERIQEYRRLEVSLNKALVLAEKTAEDVRKNVAKERELILKEANDKASMIVHKAEQKCAELNEKYADLCRQFTLYKTRFLNFLQAQVEIINSCKLDTEHYSSFDYDSGLGEVAVESDNNAEKCCETEDSIEYCEKNNEEVSADDFTIAEQNNIDETDEEKVEVGEENV